MLNIVIMSLEIGPQGLDSVVVPSNCAFFMADTFSEYIFVVADSVQSTFAGSSESSQLGFLQFVCADAVIASRCDPLPHMSCVFFEEAENMAHRSLSNSGVSNNSNDVGHLFCAGLHCSGSL